MRLIVKRNNKAVQQAAACSALEGRMASINKKTWPATGEILYELDTTKCYEGKGYATLKAYLVDMESTYGSYDRCIQLLTAYKSYLCLRDEKVKPVSEYQVRKY